MFLSCALAARNSVQWTVIFRCYLTIVSERVETLAPTYILQRAAECERTSNTVVIRLSKAPCSTQESCLKVFSQSFFKFYIHIYSCLFYAFNIFWFYLIIIIHYLLSANTHMLF